MDSSLSQDISAVAVAALPVAAVAGALLLLTRAAGLPRWRAAQPSHHGLEAVPVYAAGVLATLATALTLADLTGRKIEDFTLVGMVAALPTAFLTARLLRVDLRGVPWSPGARAELAQAVRLGALGFLIAVVPVYAVHFASVGVAGYFNVTLDAHPLAHGPATAVGGMAAYFLAVCVAAPWIEELIFRGIVLPWATWRKERMLFVFLIACVVSMVRGGDYGPANLTFVMALALVWYFAVTLASELAPAPTHLINGVVATSALFAAMHADVWPSPIPLTLLGLALGYTAVRSRGIVAPAVLHMLFNSVAATKIAMG